jgi:osmoprotectant transport system permease protein
LRDGLVVLEDDLNFFPSYRALLLFRADLPVRHAVAWKVLSGLENTISQQTMAQLNAQVEVDGHSFAGVARDYLARSAPVHQRFQLDSVAGVPTEKSFSRHSFVQVLFGADFWRLGAQHLFLVLASLSLALVVGIPLGILSFYRPKIGQIVLSIASVIQTIPSLALLAFLISVMGLIGTIPAIVALFLYALLPIIQSTHAGFAEISPAMRQAATALGLSARDQILLIELPLARTMVMSGIKVSAVLSVGTATIAAFVGAGGFGERIAQGLALNDTSMLLAGAIPAAALALLFQYVFFIVERWLKRNKN